MSSGKHPVPYKRTVAGRWIAVLGENRKGGDKPPEAITLRGLRKKVAPLFGAVEDSLELYPSADKGDAYMVSVRRLRAEIARIVRKLEQEGGSSADLQHRRRDAIEELRSERDGRPEVRGRDLEFITGLSHQRISDILGESAEVRARRKKRRETRQLDHEWSGSVYLLRGSDGTPFESDKPGRLGGNALSKIYGKLDCAVTLAAIKKGYKRRQVFFADVAAAEANGFRPCGNCLRVQYRRWKAAHESAGQNMGRRRGE